MFSVVFYPKEPIPATFNVRYTCMCVNVNLHAQETNTDRCIVSYAANVHYYVIQLCTYVDPCIIASS